jgi:hypothetical protein
VLNKCTNFNGATALSISGISHQPSLREAPRYNTVGGRHAPFSINRDNPVINSGGNGGIQPEKCGWEKATNRPKRPLQNLTNFGPCKVADVIVTIATEKSDPKAERVAIT